MNQTKTKQAILLAEGSITIRTQVKRLRECAGYDVVAAVDELDGVRWQQLGKLGQIWI